MILATAGHIDHGKTALVRALTGVDADRLPEEKRRGLTIDLGFAYTSLPDGTELGFVDVPGHERFLPNMLAGVLSIDRVLLIVAADDGPRPQTLEHLDVLELIGVAEVTGVITKIDRVPPERLAEVETEVASLLDEAGYGGSPIFPVSSLTGDGIAALSEHLSDERARSRRGAGGPAAERPVPPADRPGVLAARHRAGRDRHGRFRRGRGRRPALGQPARGRGAGARHPRAQPPDRTSPRRGARRAEPGRQFSGGRRDHGAATGSSTTRCTGRSGESISASPCRAPRRRHCATGCRCIVISGRRIWSAGWPCSGRGPLRRARAGLFRSISNTRSRRCGATARSSAITGRGTRWPAGGCSIP